LPISKSQSDGLFFRYRSQKSILQSAECTFRKFVESENLTKPVRFNSINIKKKYFNTFAGKKAVFLVFDTLTSGSKIGLSAFNSLACTTRSHELISFKSSNQYYCLNLGVTSCLYQAGGKPTYHQIPVADRYLFLVRS
jgi:hypothetical protein